MKPWSKELSTCLSGLKAPVRSQGVWGAPTQCEGPWPPHQHSPPCRQGLREQLHVGCPEGSQTPGAKQVGHLWRLLATPSQEGDPEGGPHGEEDGRPQSPRAAGSWPAEAPQLQAEARPGMLGTLLAGWPPGWAPGHGPPGFARPPGWGQPLGPYSFQLRFKGELK